MRAEYDVTADVLAGTGTASPLDFIRTVNGRLVPIDHFDITFPALDLIQAYFTYSDSTLSPGDFNYTGGVLTVDLTQANVLEIPIGSGHYFTVLASGVVSPVRPPLIPYRRAYLMEGLAE